jgi:hypothetical protein
MISPGTKFARPRKVTSIALWVCEKTTQERTTVVVAAPSDDAVLPVHSRRKLGIRKSRAGFFASAAVDSPRPPTGRRG